MALSAKAPKGATRMSKQTPQKPPLAFEPRPQWVDWLVESIDARFLAVDGKFEAVDKRFDAVDKRFDAVDKRFDAIEAKIDTMEARIERRLVLYLVAFFGLFFAAMQYWS